MSRRSVTLGLVFSLFVPACSSNKEKIGQDTADVAGFCAKWAELACTDAVVDACAASSAAACQSSQTDFCQTLVPKASYSKDGAVECLQAVSDAYEDAALTPEERAVVLHLGGACAKVVSGSIGRGGGCSSDADCDTTRDLSCVKKGEPKGTCQEAVPVGNGDDCSSDEAVCADGYYCDKSSLHCIQGNKEGLACTSGTPCAAGLRCADDANKTIAPGSDAAGTCAKQGAVSDACAEDDQCESGICTVRANGDGVCSNKTVLGPADPVCVDLE